MSNIGAALAGGKAPRGLDAILEPPTDRIRAALSRTVEQCQKVEVLEREIVELSLEAGRLNDALAPHRRAGGAA